jgi:hypothetical protein
MVESIFRVYICDWLNEAMEGSIVLTVLFEVAHDRNCNGNALEDKETMK